MRKLCLSGFRLVVLFCCLVAPPFAVYDSLNQDEWRQVATFIANLAVFNKECLLCQKRPKDRGENTSNLTKHVTVHHSRNYQNVMINFHRRTRRRRGQRQWLDNVFYRNIRQWASSGHLVTVEAIRHRFPNLLLRRQRQEVTYTMWLLDDDDTLTASTVNLLIIDTD